MNIASNPDLTTKILYVDIKIILGLFCFKHNSVPICLNFENS